MNLNAVVLAANGSGIAEVVEFETQKLINR